MPKRLEQSHLFNPVEIHLENPGGCLNYRGHLFASYNTHMHLGSVNREVLCWVRDSIVVYHGNEPKENIAKYVNDQLSWSEEVLAAHVASEAATGTDALVIPKFALPFADARVPSWQILPASVRLELLAIHADMSLINDVVEQSRTYFNLTFGNLEGSNHNTVVKNIRDGYAQYGKRCRIAAVRMHKLQSVL